MDKLLIFLDTAGNRLFSAPAQVLPQVGHKVSYSHEARDEGDWNKAAWDESVGLGKEPNWVVQSVLHSFRCLSVTTTKQVVFVTLRPSSKRAPGVDDGQATTV